MNAGCLPLYDDIEPELLGLCEDLLWNKNAEDGTDKLLAYAERSSLLNSKSSSNSSEEAAAWRNESVEERLKHSLVKVTGIKCI